jgi:hypothetical protein
MIRFYGDDLLASRQTPTLDDHPLSAVRDCLFNIFAAIFHIGGRSSIRNQRTRHAVVTWSHLSRACPYVFIKRNIVNWSSRIRQVLPVSCKTVRRWVTRKFCWWHHSEMLQLGDLNPLGKVVNFRSSALDVSVVGEEPQRQWQRGGYHGIYGETGFRSDGGKYEKLTSWLSGSLWIWIRTWTVLNTKQKAHLLDRGMDSVAPKGRGVVTETQTELLFRLACWLLNEVRKDRERNFVCFDG